MNGRRSLALSSWLSLRFFFCLLPLALALAERSALERLLHGAAATASSLTLASFSTETTFLGKRKRLQQAAFIFLQKSVFELVTENESGKPGCGVEIGNNANFVGYVGCGDPPE